VLITAAELGKLLGLTPQSVIHYGNADIVIRVGRGQYDRDASVLRYCAHLRASASGRATPVAGDRARLERAKADAAEFKLAKDKARYLPAEEVREEWAAICRSIRAVMLAVPSRIAARYVLDRDVVADIGAEIREGLIHLADDEAEASE
jgi:phage terminase Nu1 subunit (DNA packaging protein)